MMMMKKRPAPTKRAAPVKRLRVCMAAAAAAAPPPPSTPQTRLERALAEPLSYAAFRVVHPYSIKYNDVAREVVFLNRNYSRLGSFEDNDDASCAPPWMGASFCLWERAGKDSHLYSNDWRRDRRQRLRDAHDKVLREMFSGYTVLFEESDPDKIVPPALVGLVEKRVLPSVESAEPRGSFARQLDVQATRIVEAICEALQ